MSTEYMVAPLKPQKKSPTTATLRQLREWKGVTQVELRARAGIAQSEISQSERRSDHRVSNLRRYVEALGGEVVVVARFGKKKIRLVGV